ncbi:MAG TPA: hypothetical protein VNN17_08615 [Terriglobia bacterium]|nr:hypothetical protein [Terriglobia bacterium]
MDPYLLQREEALRKVAGPAKALMAVSIFALAALLASFCFTDALLSSGAAQKMPQPRSMSKETQLVIRMALNIVLQVISAFILCGAMRMRRLQSYRLARIACILAVIPCISPCYVVGIPFGIWGLCTLANPEVRAAFES